MVTSFSFVELRHHLHQDLAWITPAALRSTLIHTVSGGFSCVLKMFLRLVLLGDEGISTAGVPLDIGNETTLLFARVHTVLSDGDGLRQALEWVGASGVKPCWRHWNVMKRGSNRAEFDEEGVYVEISCHALSVFHAP